MVHLCIVSLAGQPKSIKKLKSGDLLLEVEKKKHIENLLRTKKLFNLDVNISLHKTLNCSKGVIRCEDLGPCTDVEILDHLRSQGVQDNRNIQGRRNGVLKRTSTYVLTFNTPMMPKKIKAAYISVNVEVYVPNPLRCNHCQVFGHHESRCNRQKVCANCGEDNTAVMIATVIKQQSASTAVAHTPLFHATVRLGTKKRRSLKSNIPEIFHSLKRAKSLSSNRRLQAETMPAS